MTYRIGLYFEEPDEEQAIGEPPAAYLTLKHWKEDRRGRVFLSADCVCMVELDQQIKSLHDDLEAVRRQARQRFARHEAKKQKFRKELRQATNRGRRFADNL